MTGGLIVLVGMLAPAAELPVEAPIVPESRALGEPGRYRSGRSYDETIEFYQRLFRRTGGVRWFNIVNKPGIKAKHIKSLRKKTGWDGINVYEHRGQVRIFVIGREKSEEEPPAAKRGKKK